MDHPFRSWSDLPVDILHLFLDRLYFADRERFAAVCKPWCSAVARHRSPPIPLLLAFSDNDDDHGTLLLLSPAEDGRVHRLELPDDVKGRYCYGSSHGWLFMEGDILFNPFTKEQIKLPYSTIHGRSRWPELLQAASMSSTAATVGGGVFAALRAFSELALCRLGDNKWSDHFPDLRFSDFLFIQGLLYCIDSMARLFVLELGENPKIKERCHPTVTGTSLRPPLEFLSLVLRGEELLMVVKHYLIPESPPTIGRTVWFDVFKLNPGRTEWVPVKNLDGWTLFLAGGGGSLALEASKYPSMRPNCIFFSNHQGCYMFSLEDDIIRFRVYHQFDTDSVRCTNKWLLHKAA